MDPLQSLNLPVSAQGEWAAKRFYGDPILATAYLPLAYALLGTVKNRMALGGITYGHQILHLPNGGTIRVLRNGAYNILEIDVTQVYPSPSSSLGGKHGFVFLPMVDNPLAPGKRKTVYSQGAPHATMAVACKDGTATLDMSAPRAKTYGNQYVFFGQDVYSWMHSAAGDGRGNVFGGKAIYKNGEPWMTVFEGAGIIGVRPVEIEVSNDKGDKVKELRFLVTTAGDAITLRCYREGREKLEKLVGDIPLITDKTKTYSTGWPCRFRQDGLEAAMLVSYGVTETVACHEGDYQYTEQLPATHFSVIRCAITHTDKGITGAVTTTDAGVERGWYKHEMTITDTRTSTNTGYDQNTITNEQPPKGCGTATVKWDRAMEWEQITTYTPLGGEDTTPVGLNYAANGALIIGTITKYFRLAQDRTVKTTVTEKNTYTVKYHKNAAGDCVGDPPVLTGATELVYTDTASNGVYGTLRFSCGGVDREIAVDLTSTTSATETQNNAYAQTGQNRTSSFSHWKHDESLSFITGNMSLSVGYVDVLNNTFLVSTSLYKSIISATTLATVDDVFPPSAAPVYGGTATRTESSTTENRLVLYLDGKLQEDISGGRPTTPKTTTTNGFGWNNWNTDYIRGANGPTPYNKTVAYPTSRTLIYKPTAFQSVSYNFSCAFDERPACNTPVWAYSLFVTVASPNTSGVERKFSNRCTFGPLNKHIPVLDKDGKTTEETVTDPTLTVYPIGLF